MTMTMTLPPGEHLVCEFSGTAVCLVNEADSNKGDKRVFHSLCTSCGKRGSLTVEVTMIHTTDTTKVIQ